MIRLFVAAIIPAAISTAVYADGCAPLDGTEIAKIEAYNQMILDEEYSSFSTEISGEIGSEIGSLAGIQGVYANGFDGCTTILQRADVGGLVQNVVMFDSDVGPLFGYWMAVKSQGGYRVLQFKLNSDLDEVMSKLR